MSIFRLKHSNRNGTYAVAVLLLLSLYLIGSLEIGSFHSILHNATNEAELHSEANETNACHQRVYHNQKEKECEHKSHVVANKKCSLCQLSMQPLHLFVNRAICSFEIATNVVVGFEGFSSLLELPLHVPARAPPTA